MCLAGVVLSMLVFGGQFVFAGEPPMLWITHVDIDEGMAQLSIHGQNFDNGYWPPSVVLSQGGFVQGLTVNQSDPNSTLIACSFAGGIDGFFELTLETGTDPNQFGAFDLIIGQNIEPEIQWRVLQANHAGKPLYWEVTEDFTLDLKEYFGPGRVPYLPGIILNHGRKKLYNLVNSWPEAEWAFIELEAGGVLTIKKGYRWDGPSTPDFYLKGLENRLNRASCVHDAIYDLMRLSLLDRPLTIFDQFLRNNRTVADCMLFMITREDGMKILPAESAYTLLRIGGSVKLLSSLTLPPWKYHAMASMNQVITCAPPAGAEVMLDGIDSRFAESFQWMLDGEVIPGTDNEISPVLTIPGGTHVVTMAVSDLEDDTEPDEDKDEISITVFTDNAPPILSLLENIVVPADTGSCDAVVRFNVTAVDDCGYTEVVCTPPSGTLFPVGSTTVNCQATDIAGNVTTGTFMVIVEDIEPPEIEGVLDPIILKHKGRSYAVVTTDGLILSVSDNCNNLSLDDIAISHVTSDEHAEGDIAISTDGKSVVLRRDRDGWGNGRVYTIHTEVMDLHGNVATKMFFVHICHDQKGAAIDDGPVFVVTR